MLRVAWDSLWPLIISSIFIIITKLVFYPLRTKRIWSVITKFPRDLQAAWYPPKAHAIASATPQTPVIYPDTAVADTDDSAFIRAMEGIYDQLNTFGAYSSHLLLGVLASPNNPSHTHKTVISVDLIHSGALAVVGAAQCGKTYLIHTALAALTTQYSSRDLQYVIINPTKKYSTSTEDIPSDFLLRVTIDPQMVEQTIAMITIELDRRTALLRLHNSANWREYPYDDLPLLVIHIAELFTIQQTLGKEALDQFLNDLMQRGIQLGIRPVLEVYSFAYLNTPWQAAISAHICGPLPATSEWFYFNRYLPNLDFDNTTAIRPSDLMNAPEKSFTIIRSEYARYTFTGF